MAQGAGVMRSGKYVNQMETASSVSVDGVAHSHSCSRDTVVVCRLRMVDGEQCEVDNLMRQHCGRPPSARRPPFKLLAHCSLLTYRRSASMRSVSVRVWQRLSTSVGCNMDDFTGHK